MRFFSALTRRPTLGSWFLDRGGALARGSRRFLASLVDALLQELHQIDHLGLLSAAGFLLGLGQLFRFAPFDLFFDALHQVFVVRVLELVWLPRSRHVVDQALRQFHFSRADAGRLGRLRRFWRQAQAFGVPDLVRVAQHVHH